MALKKSSFEADKIANLYRAAFYLAKGANEVGLEFLKKSGKEFNNLDLSSKKKRLYWAEKILDEYTRLEYLI